MNQFSGISTHMATIITGIPRKIILRHIHTGKLTVQRNAVLNRFEIEPGELLRYCNYVRRNEPQVHILSQTKISQDIKKRFGKMMDCKECINCGQTGALCLVWKNGYLLDVNMSSQDLLSKLNLINQLSEEKYNRLCENSRKIWAEKFNAADNYKEFYKEISQ